MAAPTPAAPTPERHPSVGEPPATPAVPVAEPAAGADVEAAVAGSAHPAAGDRGAAAGAVAAAAAVVEAEAPPATELRTLSNHKITWGWRGKAVWAGTIVAILSTTGALLAHFKVWAFADIPDEGIQALAAGAGAGAALAVGGAGAQWRAERAASAKLAEEGGSLSRQAERLPEQIRQLQSRLTVAEAQATGALARLRDADAAKDTALAREEDAERRVAAAVRGVEEGQAVARRTLDEHHAALRTLREGSSKWEARATRAEAAQAEVQRGLREANEQLEQLRGSLAISEATVAATATRMAALQESEATARLVPGLQRDLTALRNREADAKQEFDALQQRLAEATAVAERVPGLDRQVADLGAQLKASKDNAEKLTREKAELASEAEAAPVLRDAREEDSRRLAAASAALLVAKEKADLVPALSAEVASLMGRAIAAEKRAEELTAQLAARTPEVGELAAAQARVATLAETNQRLTDRLMPAEQRVLEVEGQLRELDRVRLEIVEAQRTAAAAKEEVAKLKRELASSAEEVSTAEARAATAERDTLAMGLRTSPDALAKLEAQAAQVPELSARIGKLETDAKQALKAAEERLRKAQEELAGRLKIAEEENAAHMTWLRTAASLLQTSGTGSAGAPYGRVGEALPLTTELTAALAKYRSAKTASNKRALEFLQHAAAFDRAVRIGNLIATWPVAPGKPRPIKLGQSAVDQLRGLEAYVATSGAAPSEEIAGLIALLKAEVAVIREFSIF